MGCWGERGAGMDRLPVPPRAGWLDTQYQPPPGRRVLQGTPEPYQWPWTGLDTGSTDSHTPSLPREATVCLWWDMLCVKLSKECSVEFSAHCPYTIEVWTYRHPRVRIQNLDFLVSLSD